MNEIGDLLPELPSPIIATYFRDRADEETRSQGDRLLAIIGEACHRPPGARNKHQSWQSWTSSSSKNLNASLATVTLRCGTGLDMEMTILQQIERLTSFLPRASLSAGPTTPSSWINTASGCQQNSISRRARVGTRLMRLKNGSKGDGRHSGKGLHSVHRQVSQKISQARGIASGGRN